MQSTAADVLRVAPTALRARARNTVMLVLSLLETLAAARPDLATWSAVLEHVKQNRELLITQPRVAQSYAASAQFPTSALAGPRDDIIRPRETDQLDYATEIFDRHQLIDEIRARLR